MTSIELRLRDATQLFNTLDPFPSRERDLSAEAERYIVESAEESAGDLPIEIIIHLHSNGRDAVTDLPNAIRTWFDSCAQAETRALRELFRDGRRALAIGLVALAACLFITWSLSQQFEGPFTRVLQESFVIVGWVVIWRPAEMFLYDWLPFVRRRKLYRRLANAVVTVKEEHPASTGISWPRSDAGLPSSQKSI